MNKIDSREFLYTDNLYCQRKKGTKFLFYKTEPLKKFKPEKDESNAEELFRGLYNYLIGELSKTGQLKKNPIITEAYKKWSIYILVPDKLMKILKGENAAGPHGLGKEIGIIEQKLLNKYGNDYLFDVGIVSYDEIEKLYKKRTNLDYKFSFNESTDESELVIAYLASPFFNVKSDVFQEASFNSAGKHKISFSLLDPSSQKYKERTFYLTDAEDLFRLGNNWFDDFWFPEYPYSFVFSIEKNKLVIDYSTEIIRNQEKKKFKTRNSVEYFLTSKISKNGWEITIYRSDEDKDKDFLLQLTIENMSGRLKSKSMKTYEDINKGSASLDFELGVTIKENQEEPVITLPPENTIGNHPDGQKELFDFQHTHRIFPILSKKMAEHIRKAEEVIYFGGIGDVVDSENDALLCLTIPKGSESVIIKTRINQHAPWGLDGRHIQLQPSQIDEIILKNKSFKLKIGDIFGNWNELHKLDNKLGLIVDTEPDTNNAFGYPFPLDETNAIIGRNSECDINLYAKKEKYSWDKIISSRYHAFLFYDKIDESYRIYNISGSFNIYAFNENTPKKIEIIEPLDAQILKKTVKDGLLKTSQLTNEL